MEMEEKKMMMMRRGALVLAPMALFLMAAVPVLAQEGPVEGPVTTTALISAQSKTGAPLNPSMLKLQVDRRNAPITAVSPIPPGGAQVAILIDDGLRGSFGLQLNDLKKFLDQLPAGTNVLIGYMENGTVRYEGGFSPVNQSTASQLRVPLSSPGISASPYFCLSDFVKRWPSNQPGARIVLMITNGVDPYNGSTSIMNQDSPYVQAAQDDAQRAGVAVYSIYFPDSRMHFGSFSGQSYLQQVAEATGGESFYQGTIPPVTLAPYLNEFRKDITESYAVSFMANATNEKNNTLTSIKLTTRQPGVKIHAPNSVHPGNQE
jgi:hypothetical protein